MEIFQQKVQIINILPFYRGEEGVEGEKERESS